MGFVGYVMRGGQVRVRRSGVARAERRLRERVRAVEEGLEAPEAFWESLRATFGHWSHADSWRLRERLLRRLGLLHGAEAE